MNRHNYGLGGSHKIAYKYAIENKYDYLIVAQGDDQGDPVELYDHLKSELIKNKEINMIMGSRFQDLDRIHGYSKLKILFNLFFSLIGSILFFKKLAI